VCRFAKPKENPLGVPRAVMKALVREHLPTDVDAFNEKLQQLLKQE
jgi:hypothetical protein